MSFSQLYWADWKRETAKNRIEKKYVLKLFAIIEQRRERKIQCLDEGTECPLSLRSLAYSKMTQKIFWDIFRLPACPQTNQQMALNVESATDRRTWMESFLTLQRVSLFLKTASYDPWKGKVVPLLPPFIFPVTEQFNWI